MNKPIVPRLYYLDFLRVISIFCVILIHSHLVVENLYPHQTLVNQITFNILNSLTRFAVPMFVMVSGSLLLSRPVDSIKKFYTKRLVKIGLPLLTWNLIYVASAYLADPASLNLDLLLKLFVFGQPYYLIYVMLGLYLFTPFIKKFIDKSTFNDVFGLALIILGLSSLVFLTQDYLLAGSNVLPIFAFNHFLYYLGYFLVGYVLHQLPKQFNLKIIITLIILNIFMTSLLQFIFVTIFGSSPRGNIFSQSLSPNVIIYAALLFVLIKQLVNKLKMTQVQANALEWLSTATYGVYYLHQYILDLFPTISLIQAYPPLIVLLILFSITTVATLITVFIGQKIKLLKLFLGF